MKKIFLLSVLLFLFFVNAASAQFIFTSNSTGGEKNTFYTNETVYLAGSNISTTSITVRIYITTDNNTWVNGTALTDVRGGTYVEKSTNSTGHLNIESIWATPSVGRYDVVVDVNRDGVYNGSIDYVDSLTTFGFEILLAPFPTLSVSLGSNATKDHNWNSSDATENVMIQMKLTSGAYEGVTINSMGMIASGSGDDKNGISIIRLLLDSNNNGIYDSGDNLIGYSQASPSYFKDNSFATITLTPGYTVPLNSSVNMLIAYTMSSSNSNGDTFSFQVASMTAIGSPSGQSVTPSGMPVNSAVKTVVAPSEATTTTTTETSTTSTTIPTTTLPPTTTTLPKEETKSNYLLIIIAVSVVAAVAMVIFLFFRSRLPHQNYEYKLK